MEEKLFVNKIKNVLKSIDQELKKRDIRYLL